MAWDLDPEGAARGGVLDSSPRAVLVGLERSTQGHRGGRASRLRQPVASRPDSVPRQSLYLGGRRLCDRGVMVSSCQ